MAALAKGLPVFFVPEQFFIAPVRHDVIHNRGRRQSTCFSAFRAQRMLLQEECTGFAPVGIVSPYISAAAKGIMTVQLPMFVAVDSLAAKIRTSGIAAGSLRRCRHLFHLLNDLDKVS